MARTMDISDLDDLEVEYLYRFRMCKTEKTLDMMLERLESKALSSKAKNAINRAWCFRCEELSLFD
ncbi:TPA: hypothetical protein QDZ84_003461 [Shewanella algae]|uniref:hypothetical protein n=1 Tax=Shewanella TaxID=22 RepID=UPI0014319F9A|nr:MULTISPECIES: hypothetical protein [Shewanella]NJI86927.1 hypothetical protein [Shewanella sp. Iso12]HDS1208422.1 hypothetical protein [Shewanella algae]